MKIRSMSKVDILESQRAKVHAQIPLDDPRRNITRGINMDTGEGVRLSFKDNEDMRSYTQALLDEELQLYRDHLNGK
jgi:hypothetical protein